jgi:precorrin-4/cobalt-precorrin-4 C11-methyltransferase
VTRAMAVHFIGAGPGAPDLITVRGLRLIRRCPVVLYAGSLVPEEVVAQAGADTPVAPRVIDTAALDLDAIVGEMAAAHRRGDDVARVHSGDPSFYGAIGEQMRRLRHVGIPYDVTPGVPAFAAAAAALEQELTLPGVAQSVVLTRTAVRASPMPLGETLAAFAATGATLAIHLSINNLSRVVRELTPVCGDDCPAVVLYRISWPDQRIVRGTLATIRAQMKGQGITRTALILVGRALDASDFGDSRLYAPDHHHVLRPARADR